MGTWAFQLPLTLLPILLQEEKPPHGRCPIPFQPLLASFNRLSPADFWGPLPIPELGELGPRLRGSVLLCLGMLWVSFGQG